MKKVIVQSVDTLSLAWVYIDIADGYYKSYHDIAKTIQRFRDERDNTDDSGIAEKLSKHINTLHGQRKEFVYISLVFEALTCEALINEFALQMFGQSRFKNHYDNINGIDKYKTVFSDSGYNLETESQDIFNKLQLMLRVRRKLVHCKSCYTNREDRSSPLDIYHYNGKRYDVLMEEIHGIGSKLSGLILKLKGINVKSENGSDYFLGKYLERLELIKSETSKPED
jgi:hypothetical protein